MSESKAFHRTNLILTIILVSLLSSIQGSAKESAIQSEKTSSTRSMHTDTTICDTNADRYIISYEWQGQAPPQIDAKKLYHRILEDSIINLGVLFPEEVDGLFSVKRKFSDIREDCSTNFISWEGYVKRGQPDGEWVRTYNACRNDIEVQKVTFDNGKSIENVTKADAILVGVGGLPSKTSTATIPNYLTFDGSVDGNRSKASIQAVAQHKLSSVNDAYAQRLRERPGLQGRVDVKFAIDQSGRVIRAEVKNSDINDEKLEQYILQELESWRFKAIDIPGDITEVVYPFVFSQ